MARSFSLAECFATLQNDGRATAAEPATREPARIRRTCAVGGRIPNGIRGGEWLAPVATHPRSAAAVAAYQRSAHRIRAALAPLDFLAD